jgi:glycosyltransferase involved in cell wall biosynthesis
MFKKKTRKIYYLNRYDLYKTEKFREHSGYEQVIKYSDQFSQVKKNVIIQKLLKKSFFKNLPKDYLLANLGKEVLVFFKVIFTKSPVFYLYADKDAYFLPLLKRKLKLNWIEIYGTLHWPPQESKEFSFYKNKLIYEFNGIIGLSSTINSLDHNNIKIMPHGIDLSFWEKSPSIKNENLYLIIGVSNRDHEQQKKVIELIRKIDPEAKFLLIARVRVVQKIYENISYVEIENEIVTDAKLKQYYEKAKGVILFQNFCLASNVVLESIAMCVPVIANLVGDINEYLGDDYPLYIGQGNEEIKLREFCLSDNLHIQIKERFQVIRNRFEWPNIAKSTIEFIEND